MLATLQPGTVIELDADHDVMLSQPDVVADLLNSVAG
jgi:hypothetical protein